MFYVRSMNMHRLHDERRVSTARHNDLLLRDGGAPGAAAAIGLADRFRYFIGASGRRYLFTAVDATAVTDFADAVVVLLMRDGELRVLESARVASERLGTPEGALAFVHLLSITAGQRRAVLDDLTATAGGSDQRRAA